MPPQPPIHMALYGTVPPVEVPENGHWLEAPFVTQLKVLFLYVYF